jgi:hypothetical protein
MSIFSILHKGERYVFYFVILHIESPPSSYLLTNSLTRHLQFRWMRKITFGLRLPVVKLLREPLGEIRGVVMLLCGVVTMTRGQQRCLEVPVLKCQNSLRMTYRALQHNETKGTYLILLCSNLLLRLHLWLIVTLLWNDFELWWGWSVLWCWASKTGLRTWYFQIKSERKNLFTPGNIRRVSGLSFRASTKP